GARVDHHAVDLTAERLNRVDQLPFTVVLGELQLDPDLLRHRAQRAFDVVERLASVQRRLTGPEQIQIRAVDDGDLHDFVSALSHALNCSMSCGSPGVSGALDSESSARSPEKNSSNEKSPLAASPACAGVGWRKTRSRDNSVAASRAGLPRIGSFNGSGE